MTQRRPDLSFLAVQVVVWLALVLTLAGSIRNVAWAFDSVAGGASGAWAWVQAAGVDLGLLAMALGMQLRRKNDRPVAWLRIGAVAFSVVSAGANAMHGYAHQVAALGVPAWMLAARPWSLGAILPALAFVLIEVAGHNVDKLIVAKDTNAARTENSTAAHTETMGGLVAAAHGAALPANGNGHKRYDCPLCGRTCESQPQYAAHLRQCRTRTAVSAGKETP